jgi:hypothetical protein
VTALIQRCAGERVQGWLSAVVAASDREFALTIPEKLTAEKDAVVTADLPLRGQGDAVQVTLAVVPRRGRSR